MSNDLKIPKNNQGVMPYLIVKDALKFFDFTVKVFGASELQRVMRDENTIMHGEVNISGSTIMFSDATDEYGPQTAGMFVYVADADLTYQLALDNGGETVTPLADQSYGRTGGVQDPFGNIWWITTAK